MSRTNKKLKDAINLVIDIDEQTTRYIPNKRDENPEDVDTNVDFPYIEDPEPYITNRPLEQAPPVDPTTPAAPPADIGGADLGDLGDAGEPITGGMGGMGGFGMPEEEPLTSNEIGRVYELKKIYSRLSAVEKYLIRTTDQTVLEFRKYVATAINLFEVVISNFSQFKDKIDEIIVVFYEFLDVIYSSLKKYFNSMKDGE